MAVTLGDLQRAVAPLHGGAGPDHTGIGPQPQRAALVDLVALSRHEVDDLVFAQFVELAGIRVGDPGGVAGIFDHSDLHSQADAEIGYPMLPGVFRRQDHAVDPPLTEAAGDDDAVQRAQNRLRIAFRNGLGVDPADVHLSPQSIARMAQCLCHGEIGVMKLNVFAHQTDGHTSVRMFDPLHHVFPLRQLRGRGVDAQLPADHRGKVGLLQHQRRFIQTGQRDVLNDAVGLYIAEHGDFLENRRLQRLVAPEDNEVGIDPHALKLLDRVLGGLGLVLIGALEEGHQRHMDKEAVLPAHLQRDLPDSLQKGLGLNIADGAADLGDDHVGVRLLTHPIDKFLDLIGDVGDHLHGGAQILPPALLVQNVPVHLTGGEVGVFVQILVDEPLIVTQIQIRFRTILGDVDLAVLIGAHGAGVHVDVGVQLLSGHLQPSCL